MAVEELLGVLPSGWEYTTLGDACARGGGDVQTGPFGSQLHAADYISHGVPSIMPQNIGARQGGDHAIIHIQTLQVPAGRLRHGQGLMVELTPWHRDELLEDWRLARESAPLNRIAPLE